MSQATVLFALQCEELRELIREEHFQWLAQYLVMKRASIEQNFHVLYSNFLDCLKIKEFFKLILAETYRNIRVSFVMALHFSSYSVSYDLVM